MIDLIIDRNIHGGYIIKVADTKHIFYGYTMQNAIKEYRRLYNLKYKHFNIINLMEV